MYVEQRKLCLRWFAICWAQQLVRKNSCELLEQASPISSWPIRVQFKTSRYLVYVIFPCLPPVTSLFVVSSFSEFRRVISDTLQEKETFESSPFALIRWWLRCMITIQRYSRHKITLILNFHSRKDRSLLSSMKWWVTSSNSFALHC